MRAGCHTASNLSILRARVISNIYHLTNAYVIAMCEGMTENLCASTQPLNGPTPGDPIPAEFAANLAQAILGIGPFKYKRLVRKGDLIPTYWRAGKITRAAVERLLGRPVDLDDMAAAQARLAARRAKYPASKYRKSQSLASGGPGTASHVEGPPDAARQSSQ